MDTWKGNLLTQNGNELKDVRLNTTSADFLPPCSLQFLSLVNTSRVPLHLICGPKLEVWTTCPETESWFTNHLFVPAAGQQQPEWWQDACLESPFGLLAAVPSADNKTHPRVTEVLFYAARKDDPTSPPTPPHSSQQDTPDPGYQLYALPLSSDLLPSNTSSVTPPLSPSLQPLEDQTNEGRFLPRPWENHTSTYQRRKQTLEATFTAADEARRRTKRHLGESVAAAAASNNNQPLLPSLKPREPLRRDSDRRSSLDARSQVPLFTRPATRSPSTSSLRREPTEHKRSSLARVTPAPAPAAAATTVTAEDNNNNNNNNNSTTAQKNRDAISKVVMAGMRVWGLSQSKRTKRKPKGDAPQHPTSDHDGAGKPNDDGEEYKLIYHHVYKAAVFAFRNSIDRADLGAAHAESVRDTVDTLLGVFCSEPLGKKSGAGEEVMSAGPSGTFVRTPVAEQEKRLGHA